MSNLQVFKNNEFGEIRGKLIDGQPYVVLTDVCKILGLNNVSQVKARLKKDGVITNEVTDSLGRKQIANFYSMKIIPVSVTIIKSISALCAAEN